MKNSFSKEKKCLVAVSMFLIYTSVFGQGFSIIPDDPYAESIPTVINVGTGSQIKSGGAGILGLYTANDSGGSSWLSSLILTGKTSPALVTDAPIMVYRHSINGINSDWKPDSDIFALDTNVPISVNGILSKKSIVTPEAIETAILGFDGISASGNGQALMCSLDDTGSVYECPEQERPEITLELTPSVISANSNDQVTIDWSSTNADECHGVGGPGFFADKQLSGTDISNKISLPSGSKVVFTIGCTNQLGTVTFKSAELSVQ